MLAVVFVVRGEVFGVGAGRSRPEQALLQVGIEVWRGEYRVRGVLEVGSWLMTDGNGGVEAVRIAGALEGLS